MTEKIAQLQGRFKLPGSPMLEGPSNRPVNIDEPNLSAPLELLDFLRLERLFCDDSFIDSALMIGQ
jgi:hypothetical protein